MPSNLTIDSLSFGGAGVGRDNGKVVFVPYTAPGDEITYSPVRQKKNFCEGELLSLKRPSGLRRNPECPVFGQCGGCQWQHLPYAVQGEWKQRIFGDMLKRQLGVADNLLRPILAAEDEWHYRSRVQFKCRMTADGFVMGFYRPGSHYVVDVHTCPISHPLINGALQKFRDFLPQTPYAHQIPQVDLAVGDDEGLRAVVHFIGVEVEACIAALKTFAEQYDIALFLQCGRKETLRHVHGKELVQINVDDPPLRLGYGPGGFAQVNLEQNRRLVAEVIETVESLSPRTVLDLYCGMGNFTLPLARRCSSVFGIEDFAPAIEQARKNALANHIDHIEFLAAAAEEYPPQWGNADMIVLDPPRSGAYALCKRLIDSSAQHILYVSCDPSTLSRDLKPLLHQGFSLVWSRSVDMFPQTYHIESVTLLSRTNSGVL